MPLFADKLLWLDKIESSYGTDPTPAANANAVMAFDLELNPFEVNDVQRKPATPWFRGAETKIANLHAMASYYVELAGSGTAGAAPAYGPALRAAGFAETINVGTDVQYLPVSAGFESAAAYFNVDGQRHKLLGGRASCVFEFIANETPKLRMQRTALYTAPGASAFPASPDFSSYKSALVVGKANTPTFTLHGVACVLRSLKVDMGQQVEHRDLVGSETVQITGRAPTAELLIEAPPLGTQDWFAVAKAETINALQLIHGSAAGAIIQLDLAKVKVLKPRYERDGRVLMLRMGLDVLPNAGDDEVKLTVK
jgi:hypothetical protein